MVASPGRRGCRSLLTLREPGTRELTVLTPHAAHSFQCHRGVIIAFLGAAACRKMAFAQLRVRMRRKTMDTKAGAGVGKVAVKAPVATAVVAAKGGVSSSGGAAAAGPWGGESTAGLRWRPGGTKRKLVACRTSAGPASSPARLRMDRRTGVATCAAPLSCHLSHLSAACSGTLLTQRLAGTLPAHDDAARHGCRLQRKICVSTCNMLKAVDIFSSTRLAGWQ